MYVTYYMNIHHLLILSITSAWHAFWMDLSVLGGLFDGSLRRWWGSAQGCSRQSVALYWISPRHWRWKSTVTDKVAKGYGKWVVSPGETKISELRSVLPLIRFAALRFACLIYLDPPQTKSGSARVSLRETTNGYNSAEVKSAKWAQNERKRAVT